MEMHAGFKHKKQKRMIGDFDELEKRCRFCLDVITVGDYYEDLFPGGVISKILKNKIMKCFNIEMINFQEQLPNKICSLCLKKLEDFHQFCTEFECNQEKLKLNDIKTGFLIENINSEQERDNRTTDRVESGNSQLVLKRNALVNENLKVVAVKDNQLSSNCGDSNAIIKVKESLFKPDGEKDVHGQKKLADQSSDNETQSKIKDAKAINEIDKSKFFESQRSKENVESKNAREERILQSSNGFIIDEGVLQSTNGMLGTSTEFSSSNSEIFTADSTSNLHRDQWHSYPAGSNPNVLLSEDLNHDASTENVIEGSGYHKEANVFQSMSFLCSTNKFVCKICKKGFFTQSRYDLHVIKEHDPESAVSVKRRDRIFQCNDCNKVFKNKVDITRHVSIHLKQRRPHICSICGKEYVFPAALKNHLLKHSPDYKIECPMCLKTFPKRKDVLAHKCASSSSINMNYKCRICCLEFPQVDDLKIHEVIHHQSASSEFHICNNCNSEFQTNDALMAHMREHMDWEKDESESIGMKIKSDATEEEPATFDEELDSSWEVNMCPICSELYLSNEEFEGHRANHVCRR